MSFQPVIPTTGYAGWRFLLRTLETQRTAFTESKPIQQATDYFRENIGKVRTADDLLGDRRLLQVALSAFGLEADINSKAFVRKVLEGGTTDDGALANRLADKRYAAFSQAFGFGDAGEPRTGLKSFQDDIVARFKARSFESAVGEQNDQMRLALNVSSGLADAVSQSSTPRGQWFTIMGNQPLREVFESAFGLPAGFGRLDIDKQLEQFQQKSQANFGTEAPADFLKPENQEKLIRLFLIRSEISAGSSTSGGAIALSLLQSAPTVSQLRSR
jgi:hypothetical protein